jgi:hypothetical protein
MNMRKDIQALIPEAHRDLIEAVPRGFPRPAVTGALLLGGPCWITLDLHRATMVSGRYLGGSRCRVPDFQNLERQSVRQPHGSFGSPRIGLENGR